MRAFCPCQFKTQSPPTGERDRSPVQSRSPWLLELPGISGETDLDTDLIHGLRKGGFEGPIKTYDWTQSNPGIPALLNRHLHEEEAVKISDMITRQFHSSPGQKLIVVGHSGGAAMAVFAIQKLPPDVKVDKLVLLAPALSPDYDLSSAFAHVAGNCYAFTSPNDMVVLGAGTRLFGTMDGKKTGAAGQIGFVPPDNACSAQYEKLVAKPYTPDWMKYKNDGDHVGTMTETFATAVIGPLLTAPTQRTTPKAATRLPQTAPSQEVPPQVGH